MIDFIQAFGLLLIIITCISFLTLLLKQPIIIGYVLAGLSFSFFFSGDVGISSQIGILASIGITLLLFLMGFEFDFKQFRSLGKDIAILTGAQSIILIIISIALTSFLPFTLMERIYIAIAFTLTSTILIAKWIEDKKETASMYGKMTLGTTVFQDVIAIAAITFLTINSQNGVLGILKNVGFSTELILIKYIVSPLVGLVLIFAFSFLMARYVLNFVLKSAAKLPELLLIASMSICFGYAIIAQVLGYSQSIGAFIAGIVIANTIYKSNISTRLKPLITFFNMLFFVGLGFQLSFDLDPMILLGSVVIILGAIIFKPMTVYITMRLQGYDIKTSFLSALNLSSLSEFGIILVGGGVLAGQLSTYMNSIIVLVTIASMLLSSYLIKYDKDIWRFCSPFLAHIDRFIVKEHAIEAPKEIDANVVLFGYFESGRSILKSLLEKNKKVIVITNDPDHIEQLDEASIAHFYGSASDPDFFETVKFSNVQIVVSTIADLDENKIILAHIKENYPQATTIVTAQKLKETVKLYEAKADYVIYPTYINEKQVSLLLEEYGSDISKVIEKKAADKEYFQKMLAEREVRSKKKYGDEFFFDIDKIMGQFSGLPSSPSISLFGLFNQKKQTDKKNIKENKK